MSFHILGRLVVVLGVIMALCWAILVMLFFSFEEDSRLKDIVTIIQSGVTVVAIVAGGIIAAAKPELYRDFAPHLTIDHAVSHRRVGDSYVHIAVKATLHNSSRVKVELREGLVLVQQVSPILDEEVARLFAQWSEKDSPSNFQWQTLYANRLAWDENALIVEPGESHHELYQFIVAAEVETVIVYTYYYNAKPAAAAEGWGLATVYDTMP